MADPRLDDWHLTWLLHLAGSPIHEHESMSGPDGCSIERRIEARRETIARIRAGGAHLPAPLGRLARLFAADPPPAQVPDEVVLHCDDLYPPALRQLATAPFGMFVRGDRRLLQADPAVAIVGSRTPRIDSVAAARGVASGLARAGVCIVSGLARGIDGEAHRGALAGGGPTVAVLGGGIERVHPRQNARLAQDIVESGGLLVSEFPGSDPARPWQFSRRNRIIAALADTTVVVQAMHGSGSMQTVAWAVALGKTVGAVPSWVGDPLFQGSLDLIRDGATVVLDAGSLRHVVRGAAQDAMAHVESPWGAYLDEPRLPDQLAGMHDVDLDTVLGELLQLELDGVVMRLQDGRYCNARLHHMDFRLP